jgi:peptide/nickel transport system substrate-binding protein
LKKFVLITFMILLVSSVIFLGCKQTAAPLIVAPTSSALPTTVKPAPTTTAQPVPATVATPSATSTAAPVAVTGGKPGGILRLCNTEGPQSSIAIPSAFSGLASSQVKGQIEPLIGRYRQKDEAYGLLAESWDWSNNNLTLTFHLRHGVKFQDGSDFNAKAVEWNLKDCMAAGITGGENIASINIVDDYTIQLNLVKYQNTFIRDFSSEITGGYLGQMISPTAVQKIGKTDLAWNPVGVGTGPFNFKRYTRDLTLDYVRNDNYWGQKALLDGFQYKFIADPVTAEMAFQAGEIDQVTYNAHDYQLLHDLVPKGYQAVSTVGQNFVLVTSAANPKSPWSNLKVRLALDYCLDRFKIVDNTMYGFAYKHYKNVTSCWLGYDPKFVGRQYDPAKAKALLAEAGYPNGFNTTFYISAQQNGPEALALQGYMKAVGINADMNVVSVAKWIDLETNGWADGVEWSPQGQPTPSYSLQATRYYIKPTAPNWNRGIYWNTLLRTDEMENDVQTLLLQDNVADETTAAVKLQNYIYDNAIVQELWEHYGVIMLQPYVKNYVLANGPETGRVFDNSCWLDK